MRPVLTLLLPLLLAPSLAMAGDNCTHTAPRQLQLDVAGIRKIRVETNQFDIDLRATEGPSHAVRGRACASKPQWLADLTVTQERKGDTLVVRLRREKDPGLSSLFGENYAWMELSGTVPADVLVQLVVGSGDGSIDGAAAASADVGSGDAVLRNIRGAVTAKVGSGDFELDGARGDVRVGSIGSGDAELNKVGGAVRIGSVGSGGANVRGAASLSVGSIGSGGVDHSDITGAVDLPRRD